MSSNKKYWKAIEQLDSSKKNLEGLEHNEFISKLPENFLSDEKPSMTALHQEEIF